MCGKPGTKTFTIAHDGVTVVLDVCDKDATPYDDAMRLGTASGRRRTNPTTGSVKAHAVIPVD